MKIVEIIPFLYPIGGAERLVIDLVNCASANADDVFLLVSLYSRNENNVLRQLESNRSVKIVFLNKKRGVDFRCSRRLKKVINDFDPDIVHCHLDSLLTIYLSGINKKYKTFFTFHTLINKATVGRKFNIKNLLYRYLFSKHKIYPIAISKVVKESICNYYGLPERCVPIVKNGVPLNKFRNSIDFEERKFDYSFIGRFIDIKNPDLIVEAFNIVINKFPFSKLVMIGDGPLVSKCKEESGLCLGNNIVFTGFVDDVSLYLKNTKYLILASTYEGNPMVVNEAIASGCYVIATKVGGIPDVVNDSNGKLINYDNNLRDNLAQSMIEALHDAKSIGYKLKCGYKTNQNQVSIEKTWSEYLSLFTEAQK